MAQFLADVYKPRVTQLKGIQENSKVAEEVRRLSVNDKAEKIRKVIKQ